jgi:tetratricopeptide (TPR) repeat protein
MAAEAAFDASLIARLAASDASPRNAALSFLVAEATRLRGQARLDLGRLDLASEDFAASIARLRALLDLEPGNEHWRAELVVALTYLGNLRPEQGDLAGALKAFEEAGNEQRVLLAGNPEHLEWRRNAANLVCKRAHWRGVIGNATQEDLETCVAMSATLADEYPANARLQEDLAQAHEEDGLWRLGRGEAAAAEAAIRRAVAIRKTALGADRTPDALRHLAVNYQQLGDTLAAKGETSGAREEAERALGLFRELATLRPDHPPYQRDLYTQLIGIGFLDEERGDLAAALASYVEALSISQRLAAASKDSVQAMTDHAYALYCVATIEVQNVTTRVSGISHADEAIRIFVGLERDGRLASDQLGWLNEVRDLRARVAQAHSTRH